MKKEIMLRGDEETHAVFGDADRHLKRIRERFALQAVARNGTLSLEGEKEEDVARAARTIEHLQELHRKGQGIDAAVVERLLAAEEPPAVGPVEPIHLLDRNRTAIARTQGQARYVETIRKNDLVFCTGPAGTGKTYLAVVMGLNALGTSQVRRLILARPAVEAGEKLGFLPGDMYEKVNPYVRPLYDALEDLVEGGQIPKLVERGVLEVVPIAFMRGRTLDRAFVILDEAQNCTVGQMKMFLTRLGIGSKAVVTGDATQSDLPDDQPSGLLDAIGRLSGIPGIDFVDLDRSDVVRHPLVRRIVKAYARTEPGTEN